MLVVLDDGTRETTKWTAVTKLRAEEQRINAEREHEFKAARDRQASLVRPVKELKAFAKVTLAAGEARRERGPRRTPAERHGRDQRRSPVASVHPAGRKRATFRPVGA